MAAAFCGRIIFWSGMPGIWILRFVPIGGYVTFLLCCVAFVLVYAASMWLFGFNAEEKATVRNVFGKIKRMLHRG